LPATRIGRTVAPSARIASTSARPTGRAHSGHERRARAQPASQRGVRRRTALPQRDRARDVGAALERPGRDHDHVEHQVADDGDARRGSAAANGADAADAAADGAGHD
jgi:hypothetical protein